MKSPMKKSLIENSIKLENDLSNCIQNSIKTLLETKHLYQSVKIEFENLLKSALDNCPVEIKEKLIVPRFYKTLNSFWNIYNPSTHVPQPISPSNISNNELVVYPPDTKLYCSTCKRIEAYNPQSVETISKNKINEIIQVFYISFLCQSCKETPEAFLIRREGLKLIICGRAPIEHIEVPKDIPKQVRKFYSDAILAYQSGQVLAGVFLFRTLIEQWALNVVQNKKLPADKLIDKYMDSLPIDFKGRFASLRDLYGKLSNDIHKAIGSDKLFNEANSILDQHFEARRIFKL